MKYKELIPTVHWNCNPYSNTNMLILGHPEELKNYLPMIKEKIWHHFTDITIWESQKVITNFTKLENELETIDMVIVIVSSLFLNSCCLASEVILPKVIGKGLTLLPILIDENLELSFCSKYGNLHMAKCRPSSMEIVNELLKFSHNIPKKNKEGYSWAFQNNPFSMSFFVSYRKIDGKYIDVLQNYIHQDSALWDTQLWYDSYLIPGKNYDAYLKNMIDSCNAMILIVTPQLFEENNYVLTTELPQAIKSKKVIIPIQMEQIAESTILRYTKPKFVKRFQLKKNQRLIFNFFNELFLHGSIYQLENYKSFSDIIDDVEGITLPDKSFGKVNMCDIALKYLNGDTVEQNIELAKSLLLQCAQCGEITAYNILFEVFTDSKVSSPLPYDLVSVLYCNYIEIFKDIYNRQENRRNKEALFEAIRKYGEYCHRQKHLEDAYRLFKDAYSLVKDTNQDDVDNSLTFLSVACLNIARVAEEMELFPEAERYYRKAVHIDMTIYNDDMAYCNPVTQRNLLISLYELGYYYQARKQFLDAVIQYMEILTTLENYGFMYGVPWDDDNLYYGFEDASAEIVGNEYRSNAAFQLAFISARYQSIGLYNPVIKKVPRSYVTDSLILSRNSNDEIELLSHEILLNTISKHKWLHDFLNQYEYDFDLCQYQYCVDAKVLMTTMSMDLLHTCTLIIHADISDAESIMQEIVNHLNDFWNC